MTVLTNSGTISIKYKPFNSLFVDSVIKEKVFKMSEAFKSYNTKYFVQNNIQLN